MCARMRTATLQETKAHTIGSAWLLTADIDDAIRPSSSIAQSSRIYSSSRSNVATQNGSGDVAMKRAFYN